MSVLGPILTLVVCSLAWVLGGRAERRGAALVLGAQALALAGGLILGPASPWPVILADLVMATGLLVLAVVSRRAWILAAIFAVAMILIAHSLLLDPERGPMTGLYRAVVDGLNLVGLGALLVGALQSARWRRASQGAAERASPRSRRA